MVRLTMDYLSTIARVGICALSGNPAIFEPPIELHGNKERLCISLLVP
jgi:hypothetical protein